MSSSSACSCREPLGVWNFFSNAAATANSARLCSSQMDPAPRLYLEYMPFGSVGDVHERHPFSFDECLALLHQSLSALSYLHDRPEPLVHQGINPRTILVQYREPRNDHASLRIKLSDFGFFKPLGLRSIGAATYLPPEALKNGAPRIYTTAADIWSLGLVMLRLVYGLPAPYHGANPVWCDICVQAVNAWDWDDLIDILRHMLIIDPKARHSASTCLQEVLELLDGSETFTATPTSNASAEEGEGGEVLPGQVCLPQNLPAVQAVSLFEHLDQQHASSNGDSVPGQLHPAAVRAGFQDTFDPMILNSPWGASNLHTPALTPNFGIDFEGPEADTAAPDAYSVETPNARVGRSDVCAMVSEILDMQFDNYSIPSELPAEQTGQEGDGSDAVPKVQPPRRLSQSIVIPSPVDPGVALRETLILRPLPSSGYKAIKRRDGGTVAMYNPQAPGTIKLTSLPAGMGHPKKRQDYFIGCVPPSKKTVVKQGPQMCMGTWVGFDYALELADKWDWPLDVKTAIVMAKEDSDAS